MTELVTLTISKETAKKIIDVMECDAFESDIEVSALNIVAQLYSDLTIGNKGKNNEDNY